MIYLQSNDDKNIPHHFDVACVMYGAIDNGIKYKFVTYDEIVSGKFDNLIKINLFVGSVEFMREVFNRINKQPRVPLNSDREEEIITLQEVRERVNNGKTLFIKPYDIKLFTGFVVDKYFLKTLDSHPSNTKIITSKPFDKEILSEWRVYIHMYKIFDIRNYSGDIFNIPNKNYILNIINKYDHIFPTAYTIDVGILEDGQNVIIEFNDMWAIGNYGMDNSDYLRLLKQRYFQIIKS